MDFDDAGFSRRGLRLLERRPWSFRQNPFFRYCLPKISRLYLSVNTYNFVADKNLDFRGAV